MSHYAKPRVDILGFLLFFLLIDFFCMYFLRTLSLSLWVSLHAGLLKIGLLEDS